MIYIILPLYNEGDNVEDTINVLRRKLSGSQYRIIAINDGSYDNTLEKLYKLQKEDIIIHSHLINMGIGVVMSIGFIQSLLDSKNDNDIIITMESNQVQSSLLKELVQGINDGFDIVIASRYKNGGGYVNFPLIRKACSYGANRLIRSLFFISHIDDYTIFLRSYRINILKDATKYFGKFGLIQSKGFIANVEILIKLSLFTQCILEVPFVYDLQKNKSRYKIKIFRTMNEYFVLIAYLKVIFKKARKFRLKTKHFKTSSFSGKI